MRKFLLIPFTLIVSAGICQTKISGKITNPKKNSLVAISVSIVDSYDGATTDSAGNYSFTTSEKGAQILKAASNRLQTF